eukprot:GHUV01052896.1.p1 GENE.GHUV01052896.1~~GHUV01052896.1.p1  ORF type:complete len:112 (-),score=18.30 GHUV01052896.1:9-344(-)
MRRKQVYYPLLILLCAVTQSSTEPSTNTCYNSLDMEELAAVAQRLAASGRGILAADESISTVGKRLASINVENSESNRAALRHMLFTSEGGSARTVCGGCILAAAAAVKMV